MTDKKRKWCYVLPPAAYGIDGHRCGNRDCQWSEFVDHLWCGDCKVDFTPGNWGVFDGPIGVNICKMFGIVFDRYEIGTGRVVKFDPNGKEYNETRP